MGKRLCGVISTWGSLYTMIKARSIGTLPMVLMVKQQCVLCLCSEGLGSDRMKFSWPLCWGSHSSPWSCDWTQSQALKEVKWGRSLTRTSSCKKRETRTCTKEETMLRPRERQPPTIQDTLGASTLADSSATSLWGDEYLWDMFLFLKYQHQGFTFPDQTCWKWFRRYIF